MSLSLWTVPLLLTASSATADDFVTVKSNDGRTQRRVSGQVVDYTGERLTLRHASGREETIAASRVVKVEPDRSEPHRAGDASFAESDYKQALVNYRRAYSDEDRPWVKRLLLSQLSRCFLYTGQPDQAGAAFLMLYRDDSTTPYFDAIPLAWNAIQPTPAAQQKAATWLADSSTIAKLLGASWLISTPKRGVALQALERIKDDPDPRLVYLAEAQLWRTQVVTTDEAQLARWRTRIARMPAEIRAGPYYLLGTALARQKQPEDAALAFMRVVILHDDQRDLHGASLLAAGRQLEQLKQTDEARGLYQEALADTVSAAVATEAQSRLEALNKPER